MTDDQHLPDGWAWTTLGETFEWSSGGTPDTTSRDYYAGEIPWVNSSELEDGLINECRHTISNAGLENSSAKWVLPGAVLVAMYGANIGKLGIAGFPLTTNQAIAFTHPQPISDRYLFYYLMARRDDLINLGKGAAQRNISQTVIKAFPFLLAPLAEQRRIVAAIEQQFTRLDAGVAALKRAQIALKRYRAAVLKAAVEGSLTADWRADHPAAEPADALLARILVERRARWEADLRAKGKDPTKATYAEPKAPDTASLPTLPDGWAWATVDNVLLNIKAGKNFACAERPPEEGEVGVVKVSAVTWGEYNELESKTCTDDTRIDVELLVQPGDFLFSRANTIELVGACVIAKHVTKQVMLSDKILRMRFFGELQEWVLYVLRSRQGRDEIERLATGNQESMRNIAQESIRSIHIPLPPLFEQEQIVAEVERRLSVVGELEATIAANLKRAERLRQSILREAFAGRLVPQDASDEPAAVLLARIQAERAEQAANGNGRNGHGRRNGSATETEAAESIPAGAQQQVLWREGE